MFTCQYCRTRLTDHQSNCLDCGATIKASESQPTQLAASLRRRGQKYEQEESVDFDDAIKPKRLTNIPVKFYLPENENVIMLCDARLFNVNNDVGFAVCSGRLYWRNDWSVRWRRTNLDWKEFVQRDIHMDKLQIDLGHGDRIGVAGCGSDKTRVRLFNMLKEIQSLFERERE